MGNATSARVVICGAGIAGVSAAYQLAVRQGMDDVLLVDERPPLTLTSDKSTEAYRNWWPGPGSTMVRFMNRSIDLLEELAAVTDNIFRMNRRGYVYLTANPDLIPAYERTAAEISALGAGPVRRHTGAHGGPEYPAHDGPGFKPELDGADLVLDPSLIQARFPFITESATALLHARRCGWLSAQQLGMYLLQEARRHGVTLREGRVVAVNTDGGRVRSVTVAGAGYEEQIETQTFVNAAGPLLREVGRLLDIDLPVVNELHGKVSFNDVDNVIPRHVPMMIWDDPVTLPWSDEERADLGAHEQTAWLLEEFPPGVHFRPEGEHGSQALLCLWSYGLHNEEPTWPPTFAPELVDVVGRGLTHMVPALARYVGRWQRLYVDGGYYCKTQENRPLIGPLPLPGAYVFGALSGYGIMASQAGAELLGCHIAEQPLPSYAPAFLLSRYQDPEYQELLSDMDAATGQL